MLAGGRGIEQRVMENPHMDAESALENIDDPQVVAILRALGLGRQASDDLNDQAFHDPSGIE
jgi:hypothetical protein